MSGSLADIRAEWQMSWRAGLASFVGTGLGGAIAPALFSLFILPLEEAFGWSRSQITLAFTFTMIGGFSAVFVGRLIDRLGPRRPMLAAFAMMSLFYCLLAAMPGQIIWFYVAYTLLNLFALPTTGLGYSRVLCSHFVKTRGVALAVGRAGTGLATAVLPIVLYFVMAAASWRAGYLLMASLILAIAIPVTWWGIDRPDVPGSLQARQVAQPLSKRDPSGVLALLTNRRVILISLGSALAYLAIIAITSQMQPILVDRGLSEEQAAWLLGTLGLASLVGAFGTGFLLDRFWAPGVALLMLGCGVAGTLMLAVFPGNEVLLTAAVLLVGLTLGAEIDISSYVIARYCGMASYSSVYGIAIAAIASASAVGPLLTSRMFEASGNYQSALLLCSGCFVLAAIAYLLLGRYPAKLAE